MKQARASVSFSTELISWPLSVHMALFFLDGNPRKKKRERESRDHRRAQRLSRAGHPTDGGYATNNRATFGQSDGGWFTFSPVYLRGWKQNPSFRDGSSSGRQITKPPLSSEDLVVTNAQSVERRDGQVDSQERGCALHWRLCWWVCSQTERGGEGAALLGQLSLACHPSVSSALLDIYLPCRAAGPVTCHSFPTEAHSCRSPSLPTSPLWLFALAKYSEYSKNAPIYTSTQWTFDINTHLYT